jgi:hypothetical protein
MGPLAKSQTARVTLSFALLVVALVVLASNYDLSELRAPARKLNQLPVPSVGAATMA